MRRSLDCARRARRARDDAPLAAARRVAASALLALSRPLGAARILERLAQGDAGRAEARSLRVLTAQALLHADHLAEAEAILADVARDVAPEEDSPAARLLHVTRAGLEFRRENPHGALRHYRRLGRLPERAGRARGIIATNTANSLAAAGRPRAAHRGFERARAAFAAAGSPQHISFVDQNEAYAYLREGDLGHALQLFDAALDAAEHSADLTLFPALCLDRAELFLLLSMPAEAGREVERLRRRVARLTALDEAQAAFVAAFARLLGGRHAAAAAEFRDVAGEYRQLGFPHRAAHCSVLGARALLAAGDVRAAAQEAAEARRELRSVRDPRRVSAELLAADIACRAGDVPAARAHLAAARIPNRTRLPPWMRLDIARTEAELARIEGDRARRRAALTRAADALDAQIGRLPVDEYLIGFLGARSWLYEALAADLLAEGEDRAEAAFEVVERGRARALTELLGAPIRLRASLTEERLARRRREHGIAQLQLHEAATRAEGVNPDQLTTRLRRVEDTRQRLPPPTLPTRRPWEGIRDALPTGTSILEYAWIDDGLHAFVVTRADVRHRELPLRRRAACRLVERLAFQFKTARTRPHAHLQDDASRRALEHHLRRAAAALWAPVEDLVPDGQVVIVPAEHLHLVPFHALSDDAGGRWTFSYAPSASTYVTPPAPPRAEGSSCAVFALADGNAPRIDSEARAVAAIWDGTEVLRGADANVAAFRARLGSSRIVHLATHGVFAESAPLFSSLRLADAWVDAYDVYATRIAAELVVLAACETARSVASRDADLLGLVRAFLVAGAGSVLAPQWPVSDAAAETFVVACFEALRRGVPTAEAARVATAAARAAHPHPADWAGWFAFCRAHTPSVVSASPEGGWSSAPTAG